MGRSQETFNKKEVRNKKLKKKKDKEMKKMARKEKDKSGALDDMIMYLDEDGNFSETPPDPTKKKKVIKAADMMVSTPKQEDIDMTDVVRKGVVAFFNDSKGYGFIRDTETKESIFVHINNTDDELKENNMVTFEVEMGPKGPNAINVKIDKS